MASQQSFESIIGQFKSKTEYERHLVESEKIYDLKVYRVGSMTRQQAITCYRQLQSKYENGTYQRMGTGWYENQRRLFIWFVICYSKWNKVDINNQHQWQQLAAIFFNKDPRLLKYQFMNVLKRNGRVQWTSQQDEILKASYNRHTNGEWNQIAKQLFFLSPLSKTFKTPKNCRQRWNNHLNNEVKKQPFTEEQDRLLLKNIKQKGKKWSVIAKEMGSKRTQHQIKNRWNSLIGQFIKIKIMSTNNINSSNIINNNTQNSNNNNIQNSGDCNSNENELVQGEEMREEQILEHLLVQIQKKLLTQPSSQPHQQQTNLGIVDSNPLTIVSNIEKSNPNQSCHSTFNNKNNALSTTTTHNPMQSPIHQTPSSTNFSFLNSINVITQNETQFKYQHSPQTNNHKFLNPKTITNTFPILIKSSFQSNLSHQDLKQHTNSGMRFINCGSNKNNILDKSLTAAIQDKIFGSNLQNKSDHFWMEKHTPGGFFQDSSSCQKKMSQFKLSQPGSFQRSQIAASMQMFKLPRSDMSQQYRLLTNSTAIDTRGSSSMNYQFSNDLKQL